jgi:hypothetical protein
LTPFLCTKISYLNVLTNFVRFYHRCFARRFEFKAPTNLFRPRESDQYLPPSLPCSACCSSHRPKLETGAATRRIRGRRPDPPAARSPTRPRQLHLRPRDLVPASAHDHAVKPQRQRPSPPAPLGNNSCRQQQPNAVLLPPPLYHLLRAQVNSHPRPPRPTPAPMARSAPASLVAVFLLVLALLLAIAAAQGPPLLPTNPSDGIDF